MKHILLYSVQSSVERNCVVKVISLGECLVIFTSQIFTATHKVITYRGDRKRGISDSLRGFDSHFVPLLLPSYCSHTERLMY